MGRLARLLLVALIALAHGAGFWWLMQVRERAPARDDRIAVPEPPPPPREVADETPAPSPPDDRPARPTEPAPAAQATRPPLPPPGTPLVRMLPELERRAARGDTAAACRLAVESERCLRDGDASAAVEFFERNAAIDPTLEPGAVRMIDGIERDAARSGPVCRGLQPGWAEDNAWRHMRAAADRHPPLATRYAVAPPLRWELADLQQEAWVQHRAVAPQLLRDAARAGDPHAILLLQRAYAGALLPNLPDAFAPDAALALVYAMVLLPFADTNTASELQQQIEAGHLAFDDAAWRALQAQADAITQRHFADQAPIDFSAKALGELDPQMCETP